MARRGLTYEQLAQRVAELGVQDTRRRLLGRFLAVAEITLKH